MSLEVQPQGGKLKDIGPTELAQELALAERLGLTDDTDRNLLAIALFARLKRNPSSKRAEHLKHPMTPLVRTFPFMDRVVAYLEAAEQKHQASVDKTEKKLAEFIEGHYPTPESHQHAQTIVSAVNMLVAQGLARGGNSYRGGNLFREGRPFLMIDNLDAWEEFWKPRISPLQPVSISTKPPNSKI